jgi:hypothetical protein
VIVGKRLNAVVLHTLESNGWVFVESKDGGEVWSKRRRVLTVSPSANHAGRFSWTVENRLTGDYSFDAGVTESLCSFIVSL